MAKPIIFHIDVNSAFLSWEAANQLQKEPTTLDIRTIPAVIGGSEASRHGIVLAKSIPAKKYGIVTGEPLVSARRKCPSLLCIAPNYPLYVQSSHIFISKLKSYAPIVEQYSIDEAFCDMTGTQNLYGSPITFANTLREEIREEFGFTVNIGVGPNKLLAKMASDFEKPDKVHTLFKDEIPSKMWPLPVEDLFFVGQSSSRKLRTLGINTIGDLAHTNPDLLKSHLNKQGFIIWQYANGEDLTPVSNRQEQNKGYSNAITIPYNITDASQAKQILLSLCETVATRLRTDNAHVTVVSVSIRNSNLQQYSTQKKLFSSTNITSEIYENCCALFTKLWDGTPIRQLGVATSNVTENTDYQYNLFDKDKFEKQGKLDTAIDQVRQRFGNDAIKRACFIDHSVKHMTTNINKENKPLK